MEPIAVIIPHRPGPRDQFLPHAVMQAQRQSIKPTVILTVTQPAQNDWPDLVSRIDHMVQMVKADGIDFVYIFEDDDYYPDSYIQETYWPGIDIIGINTTTYYHLGRKAYTQMEHAGRSSLFCTAFRLSAFDRMDVSKHEMFLDLVMWKYADLCTLKQRFAYPLRTPIGIKHGIGMCGGSGHSENFPYEHPDPYGQMLESLIQRRDSLEFYKQIQKQLCTPK